MTKRGSLNNFEKAMDVIKRSETKIKSEVLNEELVAVSLALRVKLGSLIVHLEEYWSASGHVFDKVAVEELLRDVEVREFVRAMGHSGLLPVKRK